MNVETAGVAAGSDPPLLQDFVSSVGRTPGEQHSSPAAFPRLTSLFVRVHSPQRQTAVLFPSLSR